MFEIGNTLREARVRRNLTLQQVEEDTKIRVKYVQAMENEDWDVMPGSTYVKGFLRTYSGYLGLDPDVIIDEYRSRGLSPKDEILEPFGGDSIIGKPRSHRGRNTIVFVAVICLLILAVVYALGLGRDRSEEPTTKPGVIGVSASPSPSKTPKPTASKTGVPAEEKNLVRIAAVDGDCWMEIRENDSEGASLFSGTIEKGAKKKFKAKVLWISLGAPRAVRLEVQGKKVKVKSDVGPWIVVVDHGHVTQGANL